MTNSIADRSTLDVLPVALLGLGSKCLVRAPKELPLASSYAADFAIETHAAVLMRLRSPAPR